MEKMQYNNSNRQAQLSNNERIINRTNQRRQKIRRKKIIIRTLVGVVFLCVGVILALTLFFNINKIVVSGDKVYSDKEIIEASGMNVGDNLIFLSKSALDEEISSKLAYVGSAKIKRRLPSTLEIVITKTDAYMAVAKDGYYILLDRNGKVLEKDLETVGENIVLANLGEINSIKVGEVISLKSNKIFTKLNDVLSECENVGITEISSVNLSDIYNIKIVYQGRITLELGETDKDNLNSKLALGKAAIERQNQENNLYRGTINLTVDGKGYWSEEVATTEPQTEESTTENPDANDENTNEESTTGKEEGTAKQEETSVTTQ
jgi:cell division protein FtsQ